MSALADPLALAQALIRCPSVTPEDCGTQAVLAGALAELGFACHPLVFEEPGAAPVANLYARRGDGAPHLAFAGHTDVVPPGDPTRWLIDPFAGAVVDGMLYGRGAVDMKGAIACFVAALARLDDARPPGGAISLLITGDEEGPAINGTPKLLAWLRAEGSAAPDGCVVGEPTNPRHLGEMVKIGRRGSLTGRLVVRGVQGHTAYADQADNPIPRLLALLQALLAEPLDEGSAHFQPSVLVPTSVDVGNRASNVIPAEARASFNVRFNDRHDAASLEALLRTRLDGVGTPYELSVSSSGEAFLTRPGPLTELMTAAIDEALGVTPALSTTGGTSDARFIKDLCPVVEFGLISATIHQVDERVALGDLEGLTRVYLALLRHQLGRA